MEVGDGGRHARADVISCRKFIQLSISFRSVRVSTAALEEGGHRLQLNCNDFVFTDVEAMDASIVHESICTMCTLGWGEKAETEKNTLTSFTNFFLAASA